MKNIDENTDTRNRSIRITAEANRQQLKVCDCWTNYVFSINFNIKLIVFDILCMQHVVYFSECSCDRRGTEVTRCPMGSPCFCDSRTGQCPCRTGVVGALCDECQDGYWNLNGSSGCQPCSCDPANAFSNVCNKATPPPETDTVHTHTHTHKVSMFI